MVNFDVTVNGLGLNDTGLCGNNTISGFGLVTFGFIWGCADIWNPSDSPITTTWVSCGSSGTIETCED